MIWKRWRKNDIFTVLTNGIRYKRNDLVCETSFRSCSKSLGECWRKRCWRCDSRDRLGVQKSFLSAHRAQGLILYWFREMDKKTGKKLGPAPNSAVENFRLKTLWSRLWEIGSPIERLGNPQLRCPRPAIGKSSMRKWMKRRLRELTAWQRYLAVRTRKEKKLREDDQCPPPPEQQQRKRRGRRLRQPLRVEPGFPFKISKSDRVSILWIWMTMRLDFPLRLSQKKRLDHSLRFRLRLGPLLASLFFRLWQHLLLRLVFRLRLSLRQ